MKCLCMTVSKLLLGRAQLTFGRELGGMFHILAQKGVKEETSACQAKVCLLVYWMGRCSEIKVDIF